MKRTMTFSTVLMGLMIILLMITLSSCSNHDTSLVYEGFQLIQNDDSVIFRSSGIFAGMEFVFDSEYDGNDLEFFEGLMSLVKSQGGRTIVALVPESGLIQSGMDLFKIKGVRAVHIIDFQLIASQEARNISRGYPEGMSINDNYVEAGNESDIVVHAKNVNDLTGFDLFLSYDPNIIEPDPTAPSFVELMTELINQNFALLKSEVVEPGRIRISAGTTGMVTGINDDDIIRINMRTKADSGFTRVQFLPESIFLSDDGEFNPNTTNGLILIQDQLPVLLGDMDLNGVVNIYDFVLFRNAYGTWDTDLNYDILADIAPGEDQFSGNWAGIYDTSNPDGMVNIMDFGVFRKNYGVTNPGIPQLIKVAGDEGITAKDSNTFEWRWLGNDYVGDFEYQMDGGVWQPISAVSFTWSGYSARTHTFSLRAVGSETISWHFEYLGDAAFFEGFEKNTLSYEWNLFGSTHPHIQSNEIFVGNNALKLGGIQANERSGISYQIDNQATMLISFYRKVSSEFDLEVFQLHPYQMPKGTEIPYQKGDQLKFYVDDVLAGHWSGDVNWGKVVRVIPAGTQSLKWIYQKDSSQDAALDSAWIDEIIIVPDTPSATHLIDLGPTVTVAPEFCNVVEDFVGHASIPEWPDALYENVISDITELWVIDSQDPVHHYPKNIGDITGIDSLLNLKYLYLAYNQLNDISSLQMLERLEFLNLKWNAISSLSGLGELWHLKFLQLDNNQIANISPLTGLNQLERLFLANNSIQDIRAVETMEELQHLDLQRNFIGEISYLRNLTGLNRVFLNDNNIYDISAITNNLGLNSGDHLNVGYNYLDLRTTSTDMSNIRTLQNRGVITEYEPSIVTGGLFWMGDTRDYGYYPDEKPIHEVVLSYDFYIGKYEVTNEEFLRFLNDSEDPVDSSGSLNGRIVLNANNYFCPFEYTNNRFRLKDNSKSKHPVVFVTWWGAMEYCNWLSRQHGFHDAYDQSGGFVDAQGNPTTDLTLVEGYRLPTEAEWEYAARGAENDLYTPSDYMYAGSNNISEVAWYQVQSTNPVGQKIPNEINLYDMSGNVWEWCNDFYSSSYYQQSPTDDPVGPANGTQHLKRGGGFMIAENCRIHGRGRNTADFSSEDLGLRIARTKQY